MLQPKKKKNLSATVKGNIMLIMEALYIKSSVFKKFVFKIVSKAPYTYLHTRRASACLVIITRNYYNIYVKNRYRFHFSSSSSSWLEVWQTPTHCTVFITPEWWMKHHCEGEGEEFTVIAESYTGFAYLHIYKLVCSSDSNNKVQQETAKWL